MIHSCSNLSCPFRSPRTTKYHTCPKCSKKLVYKCQKCNGSFFSSNLKHQKKCIKNVSVTEQKIEYLYGKNKIMMKRNEEDKICIAFFNNGVIKYAKERKKYDSSQTKIQITRKAKVQHLHDSNNIRVKQVFPSFKSVFDEFKLYFFSINNIYININDRITSECKLKKQLDKYYEYITEFTPIIVRREKPVGKETALSHLKKLYFIFGFLKKYLKKNVTSLMLSFLLKEESLRSFFAQVNFLSIKCLLC